MSETEHVALTLRHMDGSPAAGSLTCTPVDAEGRLIPRIFDTVSHALLAGAVHAEADESGEVRAALPATNDPNLDPTGFAWHGIVVQRGATGAGRMPRAWHAKPGPRPDRDLARVLPARRLDQPHRAAPARRLRHRPGGARVIETTDTPPPRCGACGAGEMPCEVRRGLSGRACCEGCTHTEGPRR